MYTDFSYVDEIDGREMEFVSDTEYWEIKEESDQLDA